ALLHSPENRDGPLVRCRPGSFGGIRDADDDLRQGGSPRHGEHPPLHTRRKARLPSVSARVGSLLTRKVVTAPPTESVVMTQPACSSLSYSPSPSVSVRSVTLAGVPMKVAARGVPTMTGAGRPCSTAVGSHGVSGERNTK